MANCNESVRHTTPHDTSAAVLLHVPHDMEKHASGMMMVVQQVAKVVPTLVGVFSTLSSRLPEAQWDASNSLQMQRHRCKDIKPAAGLTRAARKKEGPFEQE